MVIYEPADACALLIGNSCLFHSSTSKSILQLERIYWDSLQLISAVLISLKCFEKFQVISLIWPHITQEVSLFSCWNKPFMWKFWLQNNPSTWITWNVVTMNLALTYSVTVSKQSWNSWCFCYWLEMRFVYQGYELRLGCLHVYNFQDKCSLKTVNIQVVLFAIMCCDFVDVFSEIVFNLI